MDNVEFVAGSLACIKMARALDVIESANWTAAEDNGYGDPTLIEELYWELGEQAIQSIVWILEHYEYVKSYVDDYGRAFAALDPENRMKGQVWHQRLPGITWRVWYSLREQFSIVSVEDATKLLSGRGTYRFLLCDGNEPPSLPLSPSCLIVTSVHEIPKDHGGHILWLEWSRDLEESFPMVACEITKLQGMIPSELESWILEYIPPAEREPLVKAAEKLVGLEFADHDIRFGPSARTKHTIRTPEEELPLNSCESCIVQAIRKHGPLKGEPLAVKAGYPYNGYFKVVLSSLVKRTILKNIRGHGYDLINKSHVESQD